MRFGLWVGLLLLTACTSAGNTLSVTQAWARPAITGDTGGASLTAVYFVLENRGDDDYLVGIDTEAAAAVTLHETQLDGELTRMHSLERVFIPANSRLAFRPGSYHVMLSDLAHNLELGQTFILTLHFESGKTLQVEAKIREDAP